MSVMLWAVLALAAGFVAMAVMGKRSMVSAPPLPADVELPATRLQWLSRWGLGLGVVLGSGAAGVVVAYGPQRTYDDDGVRTLFMVLLFGVFLVSAVVAGLTKAWRDRDDGSMDERDREILGRAPALQSAATLVTLAVWMVGLTERFHADGAVPLFYLYLVFWSCVVVNLLGLPVGVLLGYRRR